MENVAVLGGIKDGQPIALCNGSGGSPQPGSMTKQVFTAPHHSTFDAGHSWTTTTLSDRGFALFDLQFVTADIGFVVDGVPNALAASRSLGAGAGAG